MIHAAYENLALIIDGRRVQAGGRNESEVRDPATSERLGMLPHANSQDLDEALAGAERAFRHWRQVPALERSRVLLAAARCLREDEAATTRNLTLDQGKPLAEALAETRASAEHLEWHAQECRRIDGRVIASRDPHVHQYTVREPVGVSVAITPWNFPMSQAARKVAAALGAGCTVILKGPENAPSAVLALARAFESAGLPQGCLQLVWGEPEAVSRHLINSPIVKALSFTGSIPVGKHLAAQAAARMQRMTLELGGHAPAIVCEDADIDQAVDVLVRAKFRNAGQVCIAPSRFYVHRSVHARFVEAFVMRARALRVGHGLSPDTDMGPLAHERRLSALRALTQDALDQGARLLLGQDAAPESGLFFMPTVLDEVPEHCRLMNEEPFGPIAPIMVWDRMDEVVARANRLPYGLAAYAFSTSAGRCAHLARHLAVGQLSINHAGLALAELPVSGTGDSGVGSEGGQQTFDGYLNVKLVSQRHAVADL